MMIVPFRSTGDVCRLICFPYAGASARVYRSWAEKLPSEIGVYAAEYPGRGRRSRVPPYLSMADAVADLLPDVADLADRPISLFGHSMGGAIAFELARACSETLGIAPRALFLSGIGVPTRGKAGIAAPLTDQQVLARLDYLGGTHPELRSHPHFTQAFVPILRADFRVLDRWTPRLDCGVVCPVFVFCGSQDPHADRNRSEAWSRFASGQFQVAELPGGHFFLRDCEDELLARVSRHLASLSAGS